MHGSSMKNRRQLSKGVGIAVLCYLIILSQSYMIMITCFQKVTMTKIKQQKIHLVTLFTNKQFFVQFPSNYSIIPYHQKAAGTLSEPFDKCTQVQMIQAFYLNCPLAMWETSDGS